MLYYKELKEPLKKTIKNRNINIDDNIYTFDIETTSFLTYKGEIHQSLFYDELSEKEQDLCNCYATMYIWQFSINEEVYYGRTWEDFKDFLNMLENYIPEKKIVFIHNLAFEFQFLKGEFEFENVFARKSRKPIKAELKNYNIEFRCSLTMSNLSLENLAKEFNLDYKKQVGLLDYNKLRHSNTPLTEDELLYSEFDCKVVYDYIKSELVTYEHVFNIPITSTGHVRREFHKLVDNDYKYKYLTRRSINTNPYVYNRLIEAYSGGYTHASRLWSGEILKNVDSYDFSSSYPYVMITRQYPVTEFMRSKVRRLEDMDCRNAYLLVVKFKNVTSKYHNTFISLSKCRHIKDGDYDNGRIISAKSFETTLTDIDFRFLLNAYKCDYEILESWQASYGFLPEQYVKFILEKYKEKTIYKGVEGKEKVYAISKSLLNSLYGMTVTKTIADQVIYDSGIWEEIPLTDEEIQVKLWEEKKKAFLSFSTGCWVTAWARFNLLSNVIKLDDYACYMDTDSIKLTEGYNKKVIDDYNENVLTLLKNRAKMLKIPLEELSPVDIKGNSHTIGLFDYEGRYQKFITQGAKKYATEKDNEISITVAGVPKKGAKALKRLEDFKDNFIFKYEDTNKNTLVYIDEQEPILLTDYLGNTLEVKDKTTICFLPASYTLGKALDYIEMLNEYSAKRSIYKGDEKNDKE